jgi:hypothetical protein
MALAMINESNGINEIAINGISRNISIGGVK